jgi:hypothetical protein
VFVAEAREVRAVARDARLRVAEAQQQLKMSLVYMDVSRTREKAIDKADEHANALKRELRKIEQRATRLMRQTGRVGSLHEREDS